MIYKSFLLLHLCHFRLAADCQCEHVRETVVDHMLNSVYKDLRNVIVDGNIHSNLPAMNHTSTIRKINPVAFVFAQHRGSISRYRGL